MEIATEAEERISVAPQWQLMWWRFRKHKLALVSTLIVVILYVVVAFADFLAYADPFASETQISLLIGLVSVVISLVLGVLLGGLSGYLSGVVDTIIQRVIEILRSIPTIPLWMGLAAAVPKDWEISRVFFVMTLIFSLFS